MSRSNRPAETTIALEASRDRSETERGLAEFEPELHRRARRLIGPRLRLIVAPSDLVQETLLIGVRRLSAIAGRPRREILGWLSQTMRFRVMRLVRDNRRELSVRSFEPAADPVESFKSGMEDLVREELRALVLAVVDDLPAVEKAVVEGIYRDRIPPRVLAERLGRSESAIRGLHLRAMDRLKSILEASPS